MCSCRSVTKVSKNPCSIHPAITVPLKQTDASEFFITLNHTPGATLRDMLRHAATCVREQDAVIVSQEIFGYGGADETGHALLQETMGEVQWPVTWLKGTEAAGEQAAGMQLWMVRGAKVTPIRHAGRVIGTIMDDGETRWCRLGGLLPQHPSDSREAQTQDVFAQMLTGLRQAGMSFNDVIRTWYHNDAILEWYDEFNDLRDVFFKEHHVFEGLVPASTGVAGKNALGAALTAGVLAAQSSDEQHSALPVPSPLQCPALEYGSTFSRAVEVSASDHRRLYISGTASIEPGGKTVHQDDIAGQIACTMQVVHAILTSRGMDWRHATRGIAYCKQAAVIPYFKRYCEKSDMPELPLLIAHNDICRDDLLFELELDAIAPR